MVKLGSVDLEILLLGINDNGKFNENDIEDSNLKRLGVGRILDCLASMKDRNLLTLNNDGSFEITDLAKKQLWDETMPSWVRIMKLLEIKPNSIEEISNILKISIVMVDAELESLRKKQLVLMSPIRKNEKLIPVFEILPEGKDYLKNIEMKGIPTEIGTIPESNKGISDLIEEIKNEIVKSSVTDETKKKIFSNLDRISEQVNA